MIYLEDEQHDGCGGRLFWEIQPHYVLARNGRNLGAVDVPVIRGIERMVRCERCRRIGVPVGLEIVDG